MEKAKGSFQGSRSLDIHTVPRPLWTRSPAGGGGGWPQQMASLCHQAASTTKSSPSQSIWTLP